MIYYSILDANKDFITIVNENWLNDILNNKNEEYLKTIKICKIDIDRYRQISQYIIEDKITGENITCYGGTPIEEGLEKLNKLHRERERIRARMRAIKM